MGNHGGEGHVELGYYNSHTIVGHAFAGESCSTTATSTTITVHAGLHDQVESHGDR
jgi:hypothetical protein